MKKNDYIKKKLILLPKKPGVYFFKDIKGNYLYIGKAKLLNRRVRSYFQNNSNLSLKIISMLKRAKDFEWIVTSTEIEALLTEANLIKEHGPHYNVLLRDDKTFPYIRITNENYPRVFITRKLINDGSKYFGPYTDVKQLRFILKVLHKLFPIRSCDFNINNDSISKKKHSICLDYHINKCNGPCEGLIGQSDYNNIIRNVIFFLNGNKTKIIKEISDKMIKASNVMDYVNAGKYKDQIDLIINFTKKQGKSVASFDDRDIIAISSKNNLACGIVIRIREGRISGREKIMLNGAMNEKQSTLISDFIRQFYLITNFIPSEIILSEKPDFFTTLKLWLESKKNKKIKITTPLKGEKLRLLKMCQQNADLVLKQEFLKKSARKELIPKMVNQIKEDLNLVSPPRRIEAFDISNIQGNQPVGSMVCFVDGKPRKKEYRKFSIKTVKGINDFEMIREIVLRRYKRIKNEKGILPDLIIIDGGKGQLNMAVSALKELGLNYIPIASIAKRLEEVFLPGFQEPQNIPKFSSGLILIRRIRDEAHRFAISFHRKKHNKASINSIFDNINGFGPKTKIKLYSKFSDISKIAKSEPNLITKELSINLSLASEIIDVAKNYKKNNE